MAERVAFSVFSSDTEPSRRTMPPTIEPFVSRDWMLGAAEMKEKPESKDPAESSELLERRRRDRSARSGVAAAGTVEGSGFVISTLV